MAQVHVTIIGMNRLGASLGLALKALNSKPDQKHTFSVTGSDKSATKLRAAAQQGALDIEQAGLQDAVRTANIVILTVPYQDTETILEMIAPALKPGAVVMDCALLKQPSIAWAAKYLPKDADGDYQAYLVGATVMLSPDHLNTTDETVSAANADLFVDGVMIISPALDCPPDAVQLVSDMTELMGIKAHFTDPIEHDGIVAAMENLPLLLQMALWRTVSQQGWDDAQWFGNPLFYLMTHKLLDGDPESLGAGLYRNRANVIRKLDTLTEQLAKLREQLQVDDELYIGEQIQTMIADYNRWANARARNKFSSEPSPQELGELRGASMFGAFLPNLALRRKDKTKK